MINGAIFWFIFSMLAVMIRGIRWDGLVEHAQIISGQITYPQGHPMDIYARNGFSLLTFLAAAITNLFPNPAILCGISNTCYIAASVLPVFLLTSLITSKTLWGHVAAVLMLGGILLEFDGSYPFTVWSSSATTGHIGSAYILLIVFLLMADKWRWAFFLIGLAPAIHIGQVPPVLTLTGIMVLWTWLYDDRKKILNAIPWGLCGLALCVLFLICFKTFNVSPEPSGAFVSSEPAHPIWVAYTSNWDDHRSFPSGNAHIAMAATLFLAAAAMLTQRDRNLSRIWLFLFVLILASIVYIVMTAHYFLGPKIPFLLIGWMPYRLMNLGLPILLTLIIFFLSETTQEDPGNSKCKNVTYGTWIIIGALSFLLIKPLIKIIIGKELYWNYFAMGDLVLFIMLGAACAFATLQLRHRPVFRRCWMICLVPAFIAMVFYHQFGTFCSIFGCITAFIIIKVPLPKLKFSLIGCLSGIVLIALLFNQYNHRKFLPRSDFDIQITQHIQNSENKDALLIGKPNECLRQARTGYPLLVEQNTMCYMGYMPSLAPSIQKIYQDIYGIRIDSTKPGDQLIWEKLWVSRTTDEWKLLAQTYGFDYVITPHSIELKLPEAIVTERDYLYKIPE